MALTDEQRASLWGDDGELERCYRLVSARPGTGKTTTLTEYCIEVAESWRGTNADWQGMAVVSYTNVAKDELEQNIRERGRANSLLSPPHFVGTIDAFVNQFLFLPFGGKYVGQAGARPKFVGEPYSAWRPSWNFRNNINKKTTSPVIFFDCYSLGVDGRAEAKS